MSAPALVSHGNQPPRLPLQRLESFGAQAVDADDGIEDYEPRQPAQGGRAASASALTGKHAPAPAQSFRASSAGPRPTLGDGAAAAPRRAPMAHAASSPEMGATAGAHAGHGGRPGTALGAGAGAEMRAAAAMRSKSFAMGERTAGLLATVREGECAALHG